MLALVLSLALVGQVDDAQKDREWLLAQLVAAGNFDITKLSETEAKLNRMTPSQVRVLVNVYKMKKEEADRAKSNLEGNAAAYEAAQMAKLQSYQRRLARETQYQDLVRQQQLALLRNANAYQQQVAAWVSNFYRFPSFGYGYGYGYGWPSYRLYIPSHVHAPHIHYSIPHGHVPHAHYSVSHRHK